MLEKCIIYGQILKKLKQLKLNRNSSKLNSYQIYNVKTKTHSWSDLHKRIQGGLSKHNMSSNDNSTFNFDKLLRFDEQTYFHIFTISHCLKHLKHPGTC